MGTNLLEAKHLQTHFQSDRGVIASVNDVSFSVSKGETLAIVGESGCGKSVTSLSIMGLVAHPGKVVGGEILFEGQDLLKKSKKEMRLLRGNQIGEVFRIHRNMDKKQAKLKSIEMLESGFRVPTRSSTTSPISSPGG